jgi:hypothetical protein
MSGNMEFGIQLDSNRAAEANAAEIYSQELGTRLCGPYLGRLKCDGVTNVAEGIDLPGEGSIPRCPLSYPNFSERLSPYFRAP